MHEAFYVVRGLHQALALVVAAAALPQAAPLAGALSAVAEHLDDAVRRALAGDPDAAPAALGDAQALLRRVGVLVATERARSLPVVNDHGGLSPPARDRAPSRTPRRRA